MPEQTAMIAMDLNPMDRWRRRFPVKMTVMTTMIGIPALQD